LAFLAAAAAAAAAQAASPAQRRAALIELAAKGADAAPALTAARDDDNLGVRRTAARLLSQLGEPDKAGLGKALGNSDFLVRVSAIRALCAEATAQSVPLLAKAVADPHELVRLIAVEGLMAIRPQTKSVKDLLSKATKDEAEAVRNLAVRALWPFYRENVSIRESGQYDHHVKIAKAIPLPKDGWKFKLDRKRVGHTKKWFSPKLNDSKWDDIAIEQAWQKAGYQYVGVAWYRRSIALPPKPKHVAVDLHFKGVDESTWVWVNGAYLGDHDMGPEGWDKPFLLDVTKELKWGQENQITIRAMNTTMAGGIWRPVVIEVLE